MQPPQIFLLPHVALLAKSLDIPGLGTSLRTGVSKLFARRATCGEMNICGGRNIKKYNNNSNNTVAMIVIIINAKKYLNV